LGKGKKSCYVGVGRENFKSRKISGNRVNVLGKKLFFRFFIATRSRNLSVKDFAGVIFLSTEFAVGK